MKENTTAKDVAESVLRAFTDRCAPILHGLSLADLKQDQPTFTVTLVNGKAYRITVTEEG